MAGVFKFVGTTREKVAMLGFAVCGFFSRGGGEDFEGEEAMV